MGGVGPGGDSSTENGEQAENSSRVSAVSGASQDGQRPGISSRRRVDGIQRVTEAPSVGENGIHESPILHDW